MVSRPCASALIACRPPAKHACDVQGNHLQWRNTGGEREGGGGSAAKLCGLAGVILDSGISSRPGSTSSSCARVQTELPVAPKSRRRKAYNVAPIGRTSEFGSSLSASSEPFSFSLGTASNPWSKHRRRRSEAMQVFLPGYSVRPGMRPGFKIRHWAGFGTDPFDSERRFCCMRTISTSTSLTIRTAATVSLSPFYPCACL